MTRLGGRDIASRPCHRSAAACTRSSGSPPQRRSRGNARWKPLSNRALISLALLHCAGGVRGQNTTSSNSTQTPIPIVVTNNCPDTIWPGIGTQHGTGPGTGGFELAPGASNKMFVSWDWQGRLWGRTNCTFDGNKNGVNGGGAACMTGDCFGVLDCQVSVCDLPPKSHRSRIGS